ncbi:MAG: hypothetical protein WKG06_08455 [Segetibacter sp.]
MARLKIIILNEQKGEFSCRHYVALQRKLLVLIYTLWKNNKAFDENYHKDTSARVQEAEASSRLSPRRGW